MCASRRSEELLKHVISVHRYCQSESGMSHCKAFSHICIYLGLGESAVVNSNLYRAEIVPLIEVVLVRKVSNCVKVRVAFSRTCGMVAQCIN